MANYEVLQNKTPILGICGEENLNRDDYEENPFFLWKDEVEGEDPAAEYCLGIDREKDLSVRVFQHILEDDAEIYRDVDLDSGLIDLHEILPVTS